MRAEHETEPCPVTIDFNRAHVARVFDVTAARLTSLTVFYFDRDGDAQKQEDIDPTSNSTYGDAPLRVRYDRAEDKTVIQIGGREGAIRRVVAFGSDCRSAKTNPLNDAVGDNEEPTADFTWSPEVGITHEPVTFTSTATDPDGELIHHGWDFDADGEDDATGEEVTHTFTTGGDHDVTHTVIDDFDATDSVTKTVAVEERWTQQAKLAAQDPTGHRFDEFSRSVALDGDTALIGTPNDEHPNGGEPMPSPTNAGSAYVFTRTDGTWSQQQKLAAQDPNADAGDGFGRSVALDGDTALIGAFGDEDPNGVGAGSAYVFTRSGGTWSQQQKLSAQDLNADTSDVFGLSVALDGDTALIGAPNDQDPNGEFAGSAYVFKRVDGDWNQKQKLSAQDLTEHSRDNFGWSVSIDGDTALIGAVDDEDPNGSDAGSAYVYTQSDGDWSQEQKLAAQDPTEHIDDHFGWAVSLDNDTALIGVPMDEDPNGDSAGAAYVFTRSGDTWSQQQKLSAQDPTEHENDHFGRSVSLHGDMALMGAPNDEDPNGEWAGSAYVFTRSGTTWSQQRKLSAQDPTEHRNDRFGFSVALDGDTALIGAENDEDPNGPEAGSAYVFVL